MSYPASRRSKFTATAESCGQAIYTSPTGNLVNDNLTTPLDAVLDCLGVIELDGRRVSCCSNNCCGGQSVSIDSDR